MRIDLVVAKVSRGSRPLRFASKVKGGLKIYNLEEGMQLIFTPMLLDSNASQ
jgi:hypothetical protein